MLAGVVLVVSAGTFLLLHAARPERFDDPTPLPVQLWAGDLPVPQGVVIAGAILVVLGNAAADVVAARLALRLRTAGA